MTTYVYENFDLLITRTAEGYNAHVIDSPVGEADVNFTLPFTVEQLQGFFWLSGRAQRHLRPGATGGATPVLTPQTFGAQLYAQVFAGGVGQLLWRSLDAVHRQGVGLRIRLRLGHTPELADLPWEYLYATDLARHLALSEQTPLVRYLELPLAKQPLAVSSPLRILTLLASPTDLEPLNVEQEWVRLHDALDDLASQQLLTLERLAEPTLAALQARLRQDEVHILHFIGHGDFDPTQNEGSLAFLDDRGLSHLVSATQLATLLQDHAALRLVFLNACEGAQGGRSDLFGGVAQKLVQQGLPAVLAMQFPVSDKAAIALSHEFYRALADGYPVDAATSAARKAIFAAGEEREWGTPVLFSRAADNRLLALPQGDARTVIPRQPFEPETLLIPGGPFLMGSDPGDGVPAHETPRHQVYLPDFRMGKYPITNAQYAVFIKRTNHPVPPKPRWFLQDPPPGKEQHPVVGVSWHDAVAYCAWLSRETGRTYRLPSEAEWEKAARGKDGHHYPWGDAWREGVCTVNTDDTTPVDAHPDGASPYSCQDMLGNVQEWTRTLWGNRPQQPNFSYPYEPDDGREVTANLPAQVWLVQRGGSFKSSVGELRCTLRGQSDPASKIPWRGFRVMMTIKYTAVGQNL